MRLAAIAAAALVASCSTPPRLEAEWSGMDPALAHRNAPLRVADEHAPITASGALDYVVTVRTADCSVEVVEDGPADAPRENLVVDPRQLLPAGCFTG